MDLALRTRLETDVRKGRGSASAICRRALAEHYGLAPRPDSAPEARALTEELRALTETVTQLQTRVAQLISAVLQLTAGQSEVQRLSAAVLELQRQNESLRLSLVASAYGDRTERAAAAKTAAAVLASKRP
ncbi:MAG: hypothetical protein M5U29_04275 [Anaerolineae bacterium]|nr:hypothetical protein [Anaerolineae bacterium]